jgi:hypothetical protein
LNPSGRERFGYSVSVDDGCAAIGAPGTNSEKGLVTIFCELSGEGNGWTRVQDTDVVGLEHGDNFGHRVRIKGKTLLVGAPGTARSEGAVYVLLKTGMFITFYCVLNCMKLIILTNN